MQQDDEEKNLHDLMDDARQYLETRGEYLRLLVVEKASLLFADVVTHTAVIVSFILAFLFGSVTLAFYLGSVLDSTTAGFGCVALLYLLVAIVVFLTKDKYIEKGIVNFVIRKYFQKYTQETDDNEKGL